MSSLAVTTNDILPMYERRHGITNVPAVLSMEERHRLLHEVNETLACFCGVTTKASRDPYFPTDAEIGIRVHLFSAWQRQLAEAHAKLKRIAYATYKPGPSVKEDLLAALAAALSGESLTRWLQPVQYIKAAFEKGKEQVTVKHGGKRSRASKAADVFFGRLLGLTEEHALEALREQVTIGAGGFYDAEMSEAVRAELDSWFVGELTRADLSENLEKLVNERLSTDGKTLSKNYFEGLANHYVVRARNFGGIFEAKNLGLKKYRIQGILDHRTSPICRGLIEGGKLFTVQAAGEQMSKLLVARTVSEMKAISPFLRTADEAVTPIPPLHWLCRSWIEYVIK